MSQKRVVMRKQNVTASLFAQQVSFLGGVSMWYSGRFSIFSALSVVPDWRAATSAGCTRNGGSRSCPIRSSTLHDRCSPARGNVVTCAVKTHGFMFFFSIVVSVSSQWCLHAEPHERVRGGTVGLVLDP